MSVITKTIWNVNSAHIGGSWHIDSLRGLLDGVVYINRADLEEREPQALTLRGSRGSVIATDVLEDATVGDIEMTLLDDISTSTLIAYKVTSGKTGSDFEGLYQIDAQYTETDGGGTDGYTKGEIDSKLSTINTNIGKKANTADVYNKTTADTTFVGQEAAPKVQKATAGSSNSVSSLATGATLEQAVAKINEIISTLNTVRSTAGSAYTTVNSVIDALTTGKTMKA